MCGIVGVVGADASRKVFEGLQKLEYRGYDSWGLASIPSDNKVPEFYVTKKVGKISSSINDFSFNFSDMVTIGHTRWASHGGVTEKNAHPHLSMGGKIAIVHNGIVENFAELKKELEEKGYFFRSETDSEVIANLIEENMKKFDFQESVKRSLLRINGYYAIAAIHLNEKKIICARWGSPLVLGLGKRELFVASDVTAFLEYAKKAVFVNDSQMAVLEKDAKFAIFDILTGKKVIPKSTEITWSISQAKKGNYPNFMLKEIFEQPSTIIAAAEQSTNKINEMVELLKNAKKVYLAGCGSSYHACLCASYFFSKISTVQVIPILASEYLPHLPFFDKKTLLIGVSQSGETADLLEVLRVGKGKGAKIASIVNVMDSTVMRLSDCSIMMNAGPEICVLSTKSYTSQLSILLLLAHALNGDLEKGKGLLLYVSKKSGEYLKMFDSNAKRIAKKLANSKGIFVIGRGEAYPSALEAALKIKEVSYIRAEGFAGGELKHGSIALVENGSPAVVLTTIQNQNQTLSNAIEMRSRGAFIIGIDSLRFGIYDEYIEVPECFDANPIILAMPVQLLAYHLAMEHGLDVDHPRNLAKAVSVK